MKTTISNYIYTNYNERGIRAFEKRVSKLLNNNEIFGKIICHNAYMQRGNGYGSYCQCAEIEVNGEIYTLKNHTNNSEAWDNWNEPTSKEKRQLFEYVLSENINDLKSLIEENRELNEN